MYSWGRALVNEHITDIQSKNLQLVSFDAEWKDVYLGTVNGDSFKGICSDLNLNKNICCNAKTALFEKFGKDFPNLYISASKWCPLDKCTALIIGCQYGILFFTWNGMNLFHYYDFQQNGIGVDYRLATGSMTKGIAAIGSDNVTVGTHTGTILLFRVRAKEDDSNLECILIDTRRVHEKPITELASTRINSIDILASGDEEGEIHLWHLKKMDKNAPGPILDHLTAVESPSSKVSKGYPVTAMCIWNKIPRGILIAAYGSGTIKIFGLAGNIIAQINAHSGWITALDLATRSGILVSTGEDCFIKEVHFLFGTFNDFRETKDS
ncbi:WD repeat-containing protein 54 isoform X2 [Lepeophtheirus salmonis]|uniref:WD repeat-containing protein 54 isoform X2 n=1 Tax=Lepeophtheirus salmonis TaxID=72036 RepID=UPI001AE3B015|nr:WD repeat-containing protein 54-like isoform X2 [Lepeophtheirus salmonis]